MLRLLIYAKIASVKGGNQMKKALQTCTVMKHGQYQDSAECLLKHNSLKAMVLCFGR